jgi:hypothetical protein
MSATPSSLPAAWWDDATYAPGVLQGEYAGHLGAGGIAAVALIALILGTRKGAKHGLKPMAALIWGFIGMTIWIGAGGVWAVPADLLRQALAQAGVGGGLGPLGSVGMGAIALIICLICWFVDLKARAATVMGIVMAVVFAAAGGVWGVPVLLVSQITGGLA